MNMDSTKDYEEEEKAESVDSGCVSDIIGPPETNWEQVSSALQYEYNFANGLLGHVIEHELTFEEDTVDEHSKRSKKKKEGSAKSEESSEIDSKQNSLSVEERRKVEQEIAKLKKGKYGELTPKQAKLREKKLRKQLKVIDASKSKVKKAEAKKAVMLQTEEAKKIYNNCGKLVYSKFDFSYSKKDKWTPNPSLDLKHCMSKVLKEREEIKSLESKGKIEKAANRLESKVWERAFAKANGEKVKDNLHKLSKSVAKKKQKKLQSQKKWKEREEAAQKFQEKSRDKKIQNVINRKEKQKQFREKKKKGKNSSRVPGF